MILDAVWQDPDVSDVSSKISVLRLCGRIQRVSHLKPASVPRRSVLSPKPRVEEAGMGRSKPGGVWDVDRSDPRGPLVCGIIAPLSYTNPGGFLVDMGL